MSITTVIWECRPASGDPRFGSVYTSSVSITRHTPRDATSSDTVPGYWLSVTCSRANRAGCRDAYHENLRLAGLTTPPDVFTNRDTFSRFIFRLHNIIRLETGQATDMSYEEVRDKYESFRSRCPRDLSPWRRELHMSVVPRDAARTRGSRHHTVHRT